MENIPENYTPNNIFANATKPEYTKKARWLLLLTAVMGLVFATLVYQALKESGSIREATPAYALFWGIYAAGFYALCWDRAKGNVLGWYIIASAFALMVRGAIYNAAVLSLINMAFIIPALLMLNSVVVLRPVDKGLEGQWSGEYFRGWFLRPFVCIGRWFGALGSLFKKSDDPSRRGAVIGIAIALPLAAVVLALVISSDSVMKYYFDGMFKDVSFANAVWRIVLGLAVAILFYSFIYSGLTDKRPLRTAPLSQRLPAASMTVVIAVLLSIYAMFAYFQFSYLTGIRGLPAELTYSEYAVSGFWQLVLVAAINLAVFGVTLSLAERNRATRGLLIGLLIATLVVLYSAIMRLCLYIGAYGLTLNRILPMWLMLFLLFCVVMCCIKLFCEKLHLIRLFMVVLIGWYLALNAVNLDAMVARSIIERSEERGALSAADLHYLVYDLSEDAKGVIERSQYCEEYNTAQELREY